MASPKNWKRDSTAEMDSRVVYSWRLQQDEIDDRGPEVFDKLMKGGIDVLKKNNHYVVDTRGIPSQPIDGTRFKNKQKARKAAVKWMRNNPNP